MRNFRFGFFLILAFLVIAGPVLVYGEEPKGIVPCDGPGCRACDFIQLGQNIINWFIKIAASTIALTFAWGGMKMVMSGGDTGAVSSARSIMTNSVIGLVILLGSWLIVNTILNLLVNEQNMGKWYEIQCTVLPPSPTATTPNVVGSPSGSGPVSTIGLTQDVAINRLSGAGISVTSSSGAVKADCAGTSGCTSLQGMKEATVQDAIDLKRDCKCDITITGGTEGSSGHATGVASHANGYKYDVRLNDTLNNYITTTYTDIGKRSDGAQMYKAPDGVIYAREGDHWDVQVKS